MNSIKQESQLDLLEILFAKRNRLYGAYELRRNYSRRLIVALIIVFTVLLLIFVISFIYETLSDNFSKQKEEVKTVVLENIKQPEQNKIEPPKPPPKPKEIHIKTVKLTTPKIAPDEEVLEPPPAVDDIPNAKIDVFSQEGESFDDVVIPPDADGVVDAPHQEEEPILDRVEQIAEFPGGVKAWQRYVEKEIQKHIDELTDAEFSGTIEVQFIVDKKGKVSEVKALTNPGTKLAQVAVEAIKNGPDWIPAVNNGHNVSSYRKQPVTFRLEFE